MADINTTHSTIWKVSFRSRSYWLTTIETNALKNGKNVTHHTPKAFLNPHFSKCFRSAAERSAFFLISHQLLPDKHIFGFGWISCSTNKTFHFVLLSLRQQCFCLYVFDTIQQLVHDWYLSGDNKHKSFDDIKLLKAIREPLVETQPKCKLKIKQLNKQNEFCSLRVGMPSSWEQDS